MEHTYFIWKGIDSRTMGIVVNSYPSYYRAKERGQDITIPGRQGSYFIPESGEQDKPVFDQIGLTIKCHLKPGSDIGKISNWLSGTDHLVLGLDPGYAYIARVNNQIEYSTLLTTADEWRGMSISFAAQPYRVEYPIVYNKWFSQGNRAMQVYYNADGLADNTTYQSATFVNAGELSIPAKYVIYGSGDLELAIWSDMYWDYETNRHAARCISLQAKDIAHGVMVDWQNFQFYEITENGYKGDSCFSKIDIYEVDRTVTIKAEGDYAAGDEVYNSGRLDSCTNSQYFASGTNQIDFRPLASDANSKLYAIKIIPSWRWNP